MLALPLNNCPYRTYSDIFQELNILPVDTQKLKQELQDSSSKSGIRFITGARLPDI